MRQATEVYAEEFDERFGMLPLGIRQRIQDKIRRLGRRLEDFPHERLQGRSEFRLRVGDYRIIYDFDLSQNELVLLNVGHRREVYL